VCLSLRHVYITVVYRKNSNNKQNTTFSDLGLELPLDLVCLSTLNIPRCTSVINTRTRHHTIAELTNDRFVSITLIAFCHPIQLVFRLGPENGRLMFVEQSRTYIHNNTKHNLNYAYLYSKCTIKKYCQPQEL